MVFHGQPTKAAVALVQAQGLVHGYTTVFWWCFGIFLGGAVIIGTLMRRGPLQAPVQATPAVSAAAPAAEVSDVVAEGAGAGSAAPVTIPE